MMRLTVNHALLEQYRQWSRATSAAIHAGPRPEGGNPCEDCDGNCKVCSEGIERGRD